MGMTFEALAGILGLDHSQWDKGFSDSGKTLAKFSADTTRELARIAQTSNRELLEVTKAAERLAESLGTDVAAATLLLSEAMVDPVKGYEALAAAGLKFTDAQRDEIASLQDAGRMHEAQAVVMEAVTDNYVAAELAAIEFGKEATQAADTAEQSTGKLGGSLVDVIGHLKNLVPAIGLGYLFKEGVAGVMEQEAATIRLQAALRATGGVAGVTFEQMKALADQIKQTTVYEDDAAMGAMALLASMKEIKGDIFQDVVTAAADMATVLDMDLNSAVQSLGRSLADPERGMSMLRRQGIAFTDEQVELVKRLLATGDTLKAQRVILDEVTSRYHGAAAAMKDSLGGAIDDVRKKLEDLRDDTTEKLAPSMVNFLESATPLIEGFTSLVGRAADGWSYFSAMVSGDAQQMEGINLRMKARDKEAQAQWAERSGDHAQAAMLRDEANSLNTQSEWTLGRTTPQDKPLPEAMAPKPKPARKPTTTTNSELPAAVATATTSGGSAPTATDSTSADPFGGAAESFANVDQWVAQQWQFLQDGTPEQAQELVSTMRSRIQSAIENGGLRMTNFGTADIMGFHQIFETNRKLLSQMKDAGFDSTKWQEMQSRAEEALKLAATSTGEMRQFYISQVNQALTAGEQMFVDYKKKMEETRKATQSEEDKWLEEWEAKQDRIEAEKRKKQFLIDQGLEEADPVKPNEKRVFTDGKPASGTAWMQTASRNVLQANLGMMRDQFQASNANIRTAGIGTPEQQRGLAAFGRQVQNVMRSVRDSTGDARAANIAELEKMQAAWAKAFQAIRDGSKETVEQLTKDAKKQGDAGADAAKKTTAEARKERIQARKDAEATAIGLGSSMDIISRQGAALSAAIQSSLGGLGAGAAAFEQVIADLDDPLAAIGLRIGNVKAQIAGLSMNRSGIDSLGDLNKTLNELLSTEQKIKMQEAADRAEALKSMEESWRRERAQRANAADELNDPNGRNAILGTAGGAPINLTFNGVHDAKQLAEIVVSEVNRRGYDRGPRRQPFNRR